MKIYVSRLWWYLAVALFFASIFILPTDFLVGGLLPALVLYVPVSIVWVLLSFMFYKQYGYPETTFGMSSTKVGYGLLTVGIGIVISYLAFEDLKAAQFGFLLVFCGIDWILSLREGRELLSRKKVAQ